MLKNKALDHTELTARQGGDTDSAVVETPFTALRRLFHPGQNNTSQTPALLEDDRVANLLDALTAAGGGEFVQQIKQAASSHGDPELMRRKLEQVLNHARAVQAQHHTQQKTDTSPVVVHEAAFHDDGSHEISDEEIVLQEFIIAEEVVVTEAVVEVAPEPVSPQMEILLPQLIAHVTQVIAELPVVATPEPVAVFAEPVLSVAPAPVAPPEIATNATAPVIVQIQENHVDAVAAITPELPAKPVHSVAAEHTVSVVPKQFVAETSSEKIIPIPAVMDNVVLENDSAPVAEIVVQEMTVASPAAPVAAAEPVVAAASVSDVAPYGLAVDQDAGLIVTVAPEISGVSEDAKLSLLRDFDVSETLLVTPQRENTVSVAATPAPPLTNMTVTQFQDQAVLVTDTHITVWSKPETQAPILYGNPPCEQSPARENLRDMVSKADVAEVAPQDCWWGQVLNLQQQFYS